MCAVTQDVKRLNGTLTNNHHQPVLAQMDSSNYQGAFTPEGASYFGYLKYILMLIHRIESLYSKSMT